MRRKTLPRGRVQLLLGRRQATLDLSPLIEGCTTRAFDRSVNLEFQADVTLEDVAEVATPQATYLVLLATTVDNCDAQGACGAAEDHTLIWLKIGRNLTIAAKQAFAFDACSAGRSTRVLHGNQVLEFFAAKDLAWSGEQLRIDYREERSAGAWQLVFDRQHPELGLQKVTVARHSE